MRNIDESVLPDSRGVFEDPEPVFIGTDGRIVQEFPIRCMWPRRDQMQRCDRSDVSTSMMGDDSEVMCFRQCANLSKARYALHYERFGLQYVIDTLLAHLTKLVKSSIVLAACEWYRHVAVEFGELRKIVTGQGFF